MTHRNKTSGLAAVIALGLCFALGGCDDGLDAIDEGGLTDDFIDQDVPPGVQQIEEVECARGSICVRLTLDNGDECVLASQDYERATKQEILELCGE